MGHICEYLWKAYRGVLALLEFSQLGRYRSGLEFWEEFADEFIRAASRPETDRYTTWQLSRILPDVSRETTVADLGCGFGRLAIPLAERARKVYAIDQCVKLLNYLRSRAGYLMSKIEIICARWDHIEHILRRIRPDVVILSHSLDVQDIVKTLKMLTEVTRKSIHIFTDFFPLMFRECYIALLKLVRDDNIAQLMISPAGLVFLVLTMLGVTPQVSSTIRVFKVHRSRVEQFLYERYKHLLPMVNNDFRRKFVQEVLKEANANNETVELTRIIAHIYWRKG